MVEAVWKSFNSFYTSECCLTIQSSNKVDDMKSYFYKKPCMQIFRAAAQNWKQSKCLSKGERIDCETAKQYYSVQFSSVAQLCPNLYNPVGCSMPGFFVHHQLLELAQIESVMPSNYLIGHLPTWGVHLSVSYLFAFSYCSWGSRGKNTEWFAIPFSSGPCFVRTLHYNLSILGGPTWHGSWFH